MGSIGQVCSNTAKAGGLVSAAATLAGAAAAAAPAARVDTDVGAPAPFCSPQAAVAPLAGAAAGAAAGTAAGMHIHAQNGMLHWDAASLARHRCAGYARS